jgi:hypothetical protein
LKQFSIYVQAMADPWGIGLPQNIKMPSKHCRSERQCIRGGIRGAFDPMKPFWANRNSETEKPVRDLLKREMTVFQYTAETSMEIAAFLVPARLSKVYSSLYPKPT